MHAQHNTADENDQYLATSCLRSLGAGPRSLSLARGWLLRFFALRRGQFCVGVRNRDLVPTNRAFDGSARLGVIGTQRLIALWTQEPDHRRIPCGRTPEFSRRGRLGRLDLAESR